MKIKILFPLCLFLIAIACIGFASAADADNSLHLEDHPTIQIIDQENAIATSGIDEVQNPDIHASPVKEINKKEIAGPATTLSDNQSNPVKEINKKDIVGPATALSDNQTNNTIKGPTKNYTLDIKGPKDNNLKIPGPKMSDKIKKQDQEIAKYYKWAKENKINDGHIILEIFKTHTLEETADIAAKVLSKIYCHGTPFDSSDIKDMMRLMYMGNGRYEKTYGDTPGNYGSELRLIMFQKNPTIDPFIIFKMFIFGVE